MSDFVIGGLLVSVVAPFLAWIFRRFDKKQEWARQDDVARQVREAASLLKASNLVVNEKLDVIHGLVNSDMTAAMRAEAEAVTRELAMMHEVIELKEAMGLKPTTMSLAALEATEMKLAELGAALHDRLNPPEGVSDA